MSASGLSTTAPCDVPQVSLMLSYVTGATRCVACTYDCQRLFWVRALAIKLDNGQHELAPIATASAPDAAATRVASLAGLVEPPPPLCVVVLRQPATRMMLLMNAMIIGFQMLALACVEPPDTWPPVRDALVSALVCQSAEGERFWQLLGAALLFRPSFRHGLHRRFIVNAAGASVDAAGPMGKGTAVLIAVLCAANFRVSNGLPATDLMFAAGPLVLLTFLLTRADRLEMLRACGRIMFGVGMVRPRQSRLSDVEDSSMLVQDPRMAAKPRL